MRATLHHQLPLMPQPSERILRGELLEWRGMSDLVDTLGVKPLEWICRDLLGTRASGGKASPRKGRRGLSAEQTLRALIVKQRKDLSYEELAFTLSDSVACRTFCRLQSGQFPTKGTFQRLAVGNTEGRAVVDVQDRVAGDRRRAVV